MQLDKVVFVRTFYPGIDSAGIQISEIVIISAREKKAVYLLIIAEGGKCLNIYQAGIKWFPGSTELIFRVGLIDMLGNGGGEWKLQFLC